MLRLRWCEVCFRLSASHTHVLFQNIKTTTTPTSLPLAVLIVLRAQNKHGSYFNERDPEHSVLSRVELVAKTDFRRLSYTDAIKVLEEHVASGKVTFEVNTIEWGMDLGSEHEVGNLVWRELCCSPPECPFFAVPASPALLWVS